MEQEKVQMMQRYDPDQLLASLIGKLNLKNDADRTVFEQLLGMADIVTENYRPGTMEKLGYG